MCVPWEFLDEDDVGVRLKEDRGMWDFPGSCDTEEEGCVFFLATPTTVLR